jgi:hypothetical protein
MKQLKNVWELVDDFVLEAGRVALIAALPIVIDSLQKGEVDWKLVGIAVLISLLKALDRWMHEKGVAEKGITRF